MSKIRYNERSWAIDVVSEINLFLSKKSWYLKSAGGENTISDSETSLFPDILIFKDTSKDIILHGWELKMPDTPIHDKKLIENAIKKAKILQRESFLLWNVSSAVLYVNSDNAFSILKTWKLSHINQRSEVKSKSHLWKSLLHNILEDLNSYFESGKIKDNVALDILDIDKVIDIILENIHSTSENLKNKIRKNSKFEAQINKWWLLSAAEYGYNPLLEKDLSYKLPTLSKILLIDWVFKIIFANIIKRHFNEAKQIEKIDTNVSIGKAKQIIKDISKKCNFWNIFNDNFGLEEISEVAWSQIIQLNQFFKSININSVEINILHSLLRLSIDSAKRKMAGQYATPEKLAELLVRLTIDNKEGNVLDPCCGTGTIINHAYMLKEEYEIPNSEINASIWASDKQSFPIQLSTLSLAKPYNIGQVLNIFSADVIDLKVGNNISFKNPNNGKDVIKKLPSFDYIISNLPFIKSKEIEVLNPEIKAINEWIQKILSENKSLSGKSDVFSYIPFYLYQLLNPHGKIGLVLSNAWIGTEYGEIFLELFQRFFDIEIVTVSGKGKWFSNAEVVTTLLIASKRIPSEAIGQTRKISFCTTKKNIEDIKDIKQLSENILLKISDSDVTIQQYSVKEIRRIEAVGISWCGFFANINWLPGILDKLVDCNKIFEFTRGERRGWNQLFYPLSGHNIEKEYIKPVLKNLRSTTSLICMANAEAFCCSRNIDDLLLENHTGAINWIRTFENQNNENGIPLTESLHRPNMYWYEMKTTNMADYVANINYDKSLFIAMFKERSFIDQRMIGFSIKPEYRKENKLLYLALFNSVLSMFFIESFGFGRGLGALDLRATKFEKDFKILNPNLLTKIQKRIIIQKFSIITKRERLPLEQELLQKDRIDFETTLFEFYEIGSILKPITKSLLDLYSIRFAVK